jgi:hypothetical protein
MFGMSDSRCLRKWVNQYNEHGEKYFDKPKIKPKEFLIKTPQNYEEEILLLKAENEYLKRLMGIDPEKIKKNKI